MRIHLSALILLLIVVAVVDFYLYFRYNRFILKRFHFTRKILWSFHWTVTLSVIFGFWWFSTHIRLAETTAMYSAFTWFLYSFLLIYVTKIVGTLVSISGLMLRFIQKFAPPVPKAAPIKTNRISRAQFLGTIGIAITAIPFVSMLYGMAYERLNFKVERIKLKVKRLPKSFDGLRIVQVSDIHLGNFMRNYSVMHEAADIINDLNPHLILFTGDLVNNFADETNGYSPAFSRMRATIGKFSILGNHDYGDYTQWESVQKKQQNFEALIKTHEAFGFQLLRNEHVEIQKDNDSIVLAGVENWGHPPFPQYGDLHKALEGVDNQKFLLLLSHDPDHWEAEVLGKVPADLTLAGHTHGMQMGVTIAGKQYSPAGWKYKRWGGLYTEGNQHLYINRGLGVIGLPMRVGMPPEITVIDLYAE